MHNNYIHGKKLSFFNPHYCASESVTSLTSRYEYVLSGLHLQIDPRRWAKYVFVKKSGGGGGEGAISVYICTSTCTLGGSVGKF